MSIPIQGEKVNGERSGRRGRCRAESGYILMLSLMIMLTLTVIAVGFVTNVTLETSIVRNYRINMDSLNAAEAGLEVAMIVTHEEISSSLEPYSGTKRNTYRGENVTKYGYPFEVLFEDLDGNEVKYRVIPENPDPQKNRFLYKTRMSCQEILHYAYPYMIEVVSRPLDSSGGEEYLKRQIRILETPLVQYFIFYDDDLPWHPGPEMNSWGRVHTNGNIWLCPDPSGGIWIKNYTSDGERVQHFVTASGVIYQDRVLGPNPYWTRGGHVYVRVYNLTTSTEGKCIHDGSHPNCDYIEVDTDINTSNADVQIDRFTDPNDCSYVMVGAPKSPTLSFNSLFRNGFYERKARAPERSEYFGITIVIEAGGGATWPPHATTDHTGTIHIYAATKDFAYDYQNYPDGVKIEDVTDQVFNAGDIGETGANPLAPGHAKDGTIVFSPETVNHPLTPGIKFPASEITADYPVYLERNDQRQDMRGVALTTINLKKLEKWFYDCYLDEQYDNNPGNQTVDKFVTDELTGNPTKLLIYVSRTPTAAEVPGWAGYTENGGPPYPYYDNPSSQVLQAIKIWKSDELVCPTTVATDNPVYLVGDFNVISRKGCAIVGDLVNLLSNDWTSKNYTKTGGRPPAVNTIAMDAPGPGNPTSYNAAFFSGRDDLGLFEINGGPRDDETEGIHNLLAFHEDWSANSETSKINGCLVNLWFTRQALGFFDCCGSNTGDVYNPPRRAYGWDPGYMDASYWPPYCPSAYGVERVGWFEGTDFSDEFVWDPTKQ